MSLRQSFLSMTSTHSASNSHFLFSFPLVLVLFDFRGVADALACPIISPSPHRSDSCGPFTCPHWVPDSITCWTALFPHTWRNGRGALPVAGGAATTGKDVTVLLTLRTPVRFWRNSVSPVVSLTLCLFAFTLCTPCFLPLLCVFFFFHKPELCFCS